MTARPEVSVLLPVRDAAATLDQALRSLAEQALAAIEVIAVDDGSRDESASLLDRWARRDPRLVVVRQRPAGIVAALQRAAAMARAPLLARMDADDVSEPERLARQVAWLRRRPELTVVGCRVRSFGDRPISAGWQSYERWLNRRCTPEQIERDLWIESPLAHPTVIMRRAAYRAVGGYRDFDGPEDYDLWLRLAARGARFAKVPRVLLRWRDRPERLTRRDPRYRDEAFLALKVEHLLAGPLARRAGRPLLVWGAGRYGGRLGKALLARGVAVEAFIDIDPRRVGSTRHGRPVLAPAALGRLSRPLVLVAVRLERARPTIRGRLTRRGLRELHDYWVCG